MFKTYSKTCIKGQRKIGLFKTGDFLKEVQFDMKFSPTGQK
jgi:hypothetical protein